MEERIRFIEEWQKRERSVAELSRAFGISRKTAYKYLERYDQEGRKGLEERSRAPDHSPQAISEQVAEAILAQRRQHPTWGARTIRERLKRLQPDEHWPAASTMGELLKQEGLIQPRHKRRRTPPASQPLAHATAPNQVWSADFKGWFRCGDGVRCDPLTISDAYSRYLLRCRIVDKTDSPHVRAVFEAVFREYGLPEAIRSDNGAPFASPAPGGLSQLSMWWLQLGIRHERIDPGCPQQNGRHERLHLSLLQDTLNPPAANRRQQQKSFLAWERVYNCERPHQALEWKTPSELYVASAREYPAKLPELDYPPGVHLRRISQQGSLKWHGERTFLSEVLARQMVGLLETDEEFFEVYYGPLLIGWFDGRSHAFGAERPRPKKKHKQKA